jgi:hypothetical protein
LGAENIALILHLLVGARVQAGLESKTGLLQIY